MEIAVAVTCADDGSNRALPRGTAEDDGSYRALRPGDKNKVLGLAGLNSQKKPVKKMPKWPKQKIAGEL